ncbi:MAG: hypothetical protein ACR2QT_05355 [Woeseiaceae bacterium]
MAEKIRDAEDQLLDSMFQSEPIADDGFSDRIVRRIRRGIWLRRLALPVAMLLGGAIAIKPLMQLGSVAATVSESMPGISVEVSDTMLGQLPIALTITCLLLIGVSMFKLSEE